MGGGGGKWGKKYQRAAGRCSGVMDFKTCTSVKCIAQHNQFTVSK